MAEEAHADEKAWVSVQTRTFTKWVNNHLKKKGYAAIENPQTAFEDGTNLMFIVNALYGLKLPNYNKNPKMRPHKLDNIALALKMVEDAKIKTNFLKSTHLIDHDLKMILGMIWAIILDYAIKGISEDDLTAKEGLLLWCRKKTAGYVHVDPPGVQNFSTSWKNGMALCALIHRHRPDLIDYASLDPNNARENVELAFKVAEENLDISRLLDVDDLVAVERPDERSVMTYISEFFHRFATQDIKENAARKVAKFLKFMRDMEVRENTFKDRATALINWCNQQSEAFSDFKATESVEEAVAKFASLREFLVSTKPTYAAEKLDVEALFAEIQTELTVNNRRPYTPPAECSPDAVEAAWYRMDDAEKSYAKAVKENRFRFIHKIESTVDPAKLDEIKESFNHFDKNKNNSLDKVEFKAACSALGRAFKDEASFEAQFAQVAQGGSHVTLEQYTRFNIALAEDKDTPEDLRESFQILASDSPATITDAQLMLLTPENREYLKRSLPQVSEGVYDFSAFVNNTFA